MRTKSNSAIKTLTNVKASIDKRTNEIEKLYEQEVIKLEQIAQLSQDDAKKQLFAAVEKEARADMARIYRQIEAEAREEGERRARKLIADAIQRVASDHVAEVTSSVVPIPSEEMKGRIVGRNGRNIKAFEQAAGVDVIVDDTPEAVTISCFDSVRREIARRALTRLTVDGRIHPAHIEKILEEETKAIDKIINEAGEQAAFDAGIAGLHPEVLRMMGRLKFRTSYGQNQLAHAVEVSKLAGILSAEIGANVELSKQGGFLHDIGKAMDHNQEGTHAKLGAEYCRRYGVNSIVVNAIESHHHEVDQLTIEAVIAEAADAISGARPVRDVKIWKPTSNASAHSKSFRSHSRAYNKPSRSRPDARCALSSNRKTSTILPRRGWHVILPRRLKRPCNIRVKSKSQ